MWSIHLGRYFDPLLSEFQVTCSTYESESKIPYLSFKMTKSLEWVWYHPGRKFIRGSLWTLDRLSWGTYIIDFVDFWRFQFQAYWKATHPKMPENAIPKELVAETEARQQMPNVLTKLVPKPKPRFRHQDSSFYDDENFWNLYFILFNLKHIQRLFLSFTAYPRWEIRCFMSEKSIYDLLGQKCS